LIQFFGLIIALNQVINCKNQGVIKVLTKSKISAVVSFVSILFFFIICVFIFLPNEVSALSFGQNLLINPGAEQGLYGWTEVPSDGKTYTWRGDNYYGSDYVYYGSNSFRAGDYADGILYQDVNISDELQRIVRGELKVRLTGWKRNYGDGDKGRICLQALNSSGSVISNLYMPPLTDDPSWVYVDTGLLSIPASTHKLRVIMEAKFAGGVFRWHCDAYFDGLDLRVYDYGRPDITGITTNAANNGYYKAGQNIDIYVSFSEPVRRNSGRIIIAGANPNQAIGYAEYVSGNGTNTLTFRYTVPDQAVRRMQGEPVSIYGWDGISIDDYSNNYYNASDSHIKGKIQNKNIYLDNASPAITSVTSIRVNGVYGIGDNIDVRISYDENVTVHQAPRVKLSTGNSTAGYATYTGGSGSNTIVFNYTVRPGDNTNDLHVEALEDGNVTDAFGNAADRNVGSRFRDTKDIKLDTQAPSISFVEPGDRTTYKKSHSVVINSSDNIAGSKDTKYCWNTSSNWASVNWGEVSELARNGTPVVTPPVTGVFYLHAMSSDNVGNVSYATSGPYHFDNTAPSISLTPDSGEAALNHSVKINLSDAHSGFGAMQYEWVNTENQKYYGVKTISNGGTVTTPDEEGTYVLYVTAQDAAGNHSAANSSNYVVDFTAPSISFSSKGNDQPAKSHQVTVTINDVKSNLGESCYIWTQSVTPPAVADEGWIKFYDGGSSNTHMEDISTPEGVSGAWYLHIKSYDILGNMKISTATDGFLLDNKGPELSFIPNGSLFNAGSVSTQLNINDNITKEIENFTIKYLINKNEANDGNDEEWLISTDGLFKLENLLGKYYIHAKVYDEAGNYSLITSAPFCLDNAPPTGSIHILKDYTNSTDVQVNFSAAHAADPELEEGEIQMSYRIDDGDWSSWEPFAAAKVISIAGTEGTVEGVHEIWVKYRDEIGNESPAYKDTLIYDITPPEAINMSYSITNWTNQSVLATITLSDNLCPVGEIIITNNNGLATYEFQENGSFAFEFADAAGNTGSATATVQNIEREKPVITLSPDGAGTKKRTASAVINVTDNVTASKELNVSYQWSISNTNTPAVWIEAEAGEEVTKTEGDGLWYLWVKAVDEAGNEAIYTSRAFLLDNTPPVGTITYDPDKRTAGPVIAYLSVNEPVTITNPADGKGEHVFTDNGEFTFEFVDEAGLTGTATAVVDYIDKGLPTYNVSYSTTDWTNQQVVVTVDVSGEPPRELYGFVSDVDAELLSTVEREDGTITQAVYRFTENGRLDFFVRDIETGIETEGNAIVRNIDTAMPTYQLVFSETDWTNKDVVVTIFAQDDDGSEVQITDAGGNVIPDTYTFTENGEYTFYIRDKAGNVLPATAVVSNIDKEVPVPVITYSNDGKWTNQDITATIAFLYEAEPVTIINNGGSNMYTFKQNGSFIFYYRDAAGNEGQAAATVDKIDRVSPIGEILYIDYDNNWTNKDVTAKLAAYDDKSTVTILNNDGSDEYVFTENGEFTFEFCDEAGNIGTATAIISRIDKIPPQVEVDYSITTVTNISVMATITANEPITVINNKGSNVYYFTENGLFTFEVVDRAGNMVTRTAGVNWIDKTPPKPTLIYSTTDLTKDDVIVTVEADEEFIVLNNSRRTQRVFTENGTFVFYIQDIAGNTAEIEAVVTNIDKSKANITLEYSETEPTRNNVTVTIKADRPVTAHNSDGIDNNGNPYVVFSQNGTRWVKIADNLGNERELRIVVSNIDREAPVISFLEGERLIVVKGSEIQPLSDVKATDNLDGDVLSQVVVTHNIDTGTPGEYEIMYTVTDKAGNTSSIVRKADVIAEAEFCVFINSNFPKNGEIMIEGSNISIKTVGTMGQVVIKWAEGKKSRGEFKRIENYIEDGNLIVTRSGYYSIFVQDQERQTKLVHVYVIHK